MCGHDDIYPSGDCRTCSREYQKRYRAKQSKGMLIIKAAEERGMTAADALKIIAEAPIEVLHHFSRSNPELVARVLERIK